MVAYLVDQMVVWWDGQMAVSLAFQQVVWLVVK